MIDILLILVIIAILVISHLERKDLYTRLMSRDVIEYKSVTKEDKNEIEPIDPNLIPLEDAEDLIREDINHG